MYGAVTEDHVLWARSYNNLSSIRITLYSVFRVSSENLIHAACFDMQMKIRAIQLTCKLASDVIRWLLTPSRACINYFPLKSPANSVLMLSSFVMHDTFYLSMSFQPFFLIDHKCRENQINTFVCLFVWGHVALVACKHNITSLRQCYSVKHDCFGHNLCVCVHFTEQNNFLFLGARSTNFQEFRSYNAQGCGR